MPPSAMTAMLVVPPPMSITMLPVGVSTGRPTPIAAAIGSDTISRRLTPAERAESRTARRSTSVMPEGTQTMTVGLTLRTVRSMTWRRKWRSIFSATSKFAMTPSFIGPHRVDPIRRTAEHHLGLAADAHDVPGMVYGGDRRLIEHHPFALDEDEGVGGAEVHGHLGRRTPPLPLGQPREAAI